MKSGLLSPFTSFLFILNVGLCQSPDNKLFVEQKERVLPDITSMYDSIRKRIIPVAFYSSQTGQRQEIVIFNHGYGYNKGGDYLAYSYLTEYLAAKGYFVASIQHEIATDSLLPLIGIPQVVRKPFWERGADNIMFVINQLKKNNPPLDFSRITLIGHSNGGDMVALFPKKYPNIVNKIITLDNRRMALPRKTRPRVYSLRSSDQPADEGVLPTTKEQEKFKINIIKLLNTPHHNMDDSANDVQREEIRGLVLGFMNQN